MGCVKSKVDDKKEIDLSVKKQRSCTDLPCCLLYIVFLLAFIAIGAIGLIKGSPYSLVYARDYQGNLCGLDGRGVNIYYPRLNQDLASYMQQNKISSPLSVDITSIPLYGICVTQCPLASQVVCNYNVSPVLTTAQYTAQCGTIALQAANAVCKTCWMSPLNSSPFMYRCAWEETSKSVATERCTQPDSPADPTAPGYVNPKSTDCLAKEVLMVYVR
jgi:hypothetical protein